MTIRPNSYVDGELLELAEMARRFATERVAPGFVERDTTRALDRALSEEMGALGLIAPELSESSGGQGASRVAAGVIHEQIATADLSLSYVNLLGSLNAQILAEHGDPAVVDPWLHEIAAGRAIAALGLTEPSGGSDAAGAASIPVEMVVGMRERLGFESIVTAYGMTETSGLVTHTRRGDPNEVVSATSGRVIDDVEVRIVDDDGHDVPAGVAGELLVRRYQVTPGYLGGPGGVTPATDDEGWLSTGDVVVMDESGYIDITDRKKDIYIVGGFNAYPAEIERMMVEPPDVAVAAVIGIPDDRLGEVGAAFVVPTANHTPDEAELIAWCRETMANYKVPRRIWIVDSLPMTASNKTQKPELRRLAAELIASG